VGDAWVVNDPVTGQGANLGSHSAFVLADEIIAGPPYDEAFCRRAEARMWEFAQPVTEWTNAFLQPPPPHALAVLGAASRDQRVADAFVDNFNDPVAQWAALRTPEGAAAWLAGFAEEAEEEADA
jgi:2-polyprenyl-6-methoxyphenol hydroxylase-like FAD-dependent oxidoreductase